MERYGLGRTLRTMLNMLILMITDRKARQFVRGGVGGLSKEILEDLGYGVFVGWRS
jgi:hypothetical protein